MRGREEVTFNAKTNRGGCRQIRPNAQLAAWCTRVDPRAIGHREALRVRPWFLKVAMADDQTWDVEMGRKC
jgi:hypothetical protein